MLTDPVLTQVDEATSDNVYQTTQLCIPPLFFPPGMIDRILQLGYLKWSDVPLHLVFRNFIFFRPFILTSVGMWGFPLEHHYTIQSSFSLN